MEISRTGPFLRFLVPLVGGIACGEAHPYVLPVWIGVGMVLLAIGLYKFSHRPVCTRLFGLVVLLFFFTTGYTSVSRQLRQAAYDFPNGDTAAAYRIALVEKPEMKKRSIMYRATLKGELRKDTLLPCPEEKTFLLYFPQDPATGILKRGDELLIHARLSPPGNNGNPDEFDYVRYLRRKGVSGTAYVPLGHWQVIGHNATPTLRQRALDCRGKVVELYRHMGFSGDELAVLSALTIGDKEELSEEIMETYSVAGASHVLALSGLHIGFISGMLIFLLSPLWRRWQRLKPFIFIGVIFLLWVFAFITGLSPSVVRAVIMCSFGLLFLLRKEKNLSLNTWAATAFLMLLYNPAWLFDVGFQLSFCAVAAILILQPVLYGLISFQNRLLRYAWGLITVSVAAQIGTAPLVILYFSRFSTHFLLTNIWVIPWVSLIMYAAFLLLLLTPFPYLQYSFATVVEAMVRFQNSGLRRIEEMPLASIDHIWTNIWEITLFYLLLLSLYQVWRCCIARNVYVVLFILLGCASYHTYIRIANTPKRSIAFYNIRGCPSIHCITASPRSWLVCPDSLSDTSYLYRALSPHWNRLRLESPTKITEDYVTPEITVQNRMIVYGGKRICLLHDDYWRYKTIEKPIHIDYLYLSKGYKGSVEELTALFDMGMVVIDSSLSTYYRNKAIEDCTRLGISYHSLAEEGVMRIRL